MKLHSLLILLFCVLASPLRAQDDVYAAQRSAWLEQAEAAKPQLKETIVKPRCLVQPIADKGAWQGWRFEDAAPLDSLYKRSIKASPCVTVDFGRHMVGHYAFFVKTTARCQDAPLRLKFTFGETPAELNTPLDPYPGTLSRAWMQDEVVTLTTIDEWVTVPRRVACRYVKIELLGVSPDFDCALTDMEFRATSAVGTCTLPHAEGCPDRVRKIEDVAVETLRECMQTVYEDGPKRDRRLWAGDLYLQALANMYSFEDYNLTRRCLYLLAALSADNGRLHANVFEAPTPHPQYGSHCEDYSLLYTATLADYLEATGDVQTTEDLWPVVERQIEWALSFVGKDNVYDPQAHGDWQWLFFDWKAGLQPKAAMQGLVVYVLRKDAEMARRIGKADEARQWDKTADRMAAAARRTYYDKQRGIYRSGSADGQINWMTQIWMTLAGIERGPEALRRIMEMPEALGLGAPYAHHYLVEAMISCGMKDEARQHLLDYWGSMVDKGADTFWEVYDPTNAELSPYNFFPMNSACHAWSCTPVYFIQKYPDIFQR